MKTIRKTVSEIKKDPIWKGVTPKDEEFYQCLRHIGKSYGDKKKWEIGNMCEGHNGLAKITKKSVIEFVNENDAIIERIHKYKKKYKKIIKILDGK